MPRDFDVVIGGGAMVGAAVAALLVTDPRARGLRVALVEANPATMPLRHEPPELRVSALSRASEQLLRAVGAWDPLSARAPCAYERMRVWDEASAADSEEALVFDAALLGERDLGCIVENRAVAAALLAAALRHGVTVFAAPVEGLTVTADVAEVLVGGRSLKTALVVAADGAASTLRAQAGIAVTARPYDQRAVVACLACERPHGAEARQRFLADGPVALLPLADGSVSLVWSTRTDEAERLVALTDEDFSAAVTAATDRVLGELTVHGARQSFPLSRDHADTYAVARVALVGDAAHTIHPLAGQGVNLGFLDAAQLAETVLAARDAGEDWGDRAVLGRYSRARRAENLLVAAALDNLNRLFTAKGSAVASLRRAGLRAVNGSPLVKSRLIREAMGITDRRPARLRESAF